MKFNTDNKQLTKRIIIGMVSGLVLGISLNLIGREGFIENYLISGVFHVGGQIFLASLKLLVVPLVFVSLVCGTAALDDIVKLGRIGGKTIALYLFTTAVAITIALIVAIIVKPGVGFELQTSAAFVSQEAPSLIQVIIDIFPTNPIKAMAEGKMLQIIVFSCLFGVSMTLAGEPGKRILSVFNDLNTIIMKMIMMLMLFAPIGVFCLISKVFSEQGFSAIVPLAKYFFVVLFVLFIHVILTYGTILKVISRLSPITFIKKMRNPIVFAFSTASSNATIPVTMEAVEQKLGVKNSVASFTIPLGATINMDGTAIMQGVATVFISQAYGIEIGPAGYLMVILTAILASIGTAGVPGVGLIMLAMVLRQVGLPVEGIGLIIGVDRLLDMTRTAVNITGDAVVTCIVANSEGQLTKKVFDSKNE